MGAYSRGGAYSYCKNIFYVGDYSWEGLRQKLYIKCLKLHKNDLKIHNIPCLWGKMFCQLGVIFAQFFKSQYPWVCQFQYLYDLPVSVSIESVSLHESLSLRESVSLSMSMNHSVSESDSLGNHTYSGQESSLILPPCFQRMQPMWYANWWKTMFK